MQGRRGRSDQGHRVPGGRDKPLDRRHPAEGLAQDIAPELDGGREDRKSDSHETNRPWHI